MKNKKVLFSLLLLYSISISCQKRTIPEVLHSYDIDESLPEYYSKQYLPDKITEVVNSFSGDSTSMDSFVFITDTHWEKNSCYSGLLIKAILDNTPVGKVIHGGDAGSVTAYDSILTGYDLINDNMAKFVDFLINNIKGHPFFAVRGNHDFNNMLEDGKQIGYPISEVISFYLSFMPEVPYRSLDDNGLYYYFDNQNCKVRYIVIDSSYGCKIDMTRLGVKQLQWLVNDAISSTPRDYSIVLFSHIPIDKADDNMIFAPLKTILSAVNNRSSGSVVCEGIEVPYDFSMVEFNVFFVMSGHIHTDSQAYDERVLYLTTACDRVSNEMVSQYDEVPRQIRRSGDVFEQAFDVVTINHSEENWIDLMRIGAGFSRFFNRDIIEIRVGESVNLTEKLSKITPQKWRCNDSPGPIGSWRDKEWIYTSTVLKISDGVVLANKPGSAIVYAEDSRRNKEFFLIDVID